MKGGKGWSTVLPNWEDGVGNMAQNEVIDDDEYYSEYLNGWITVNWQITTSTYVIIE